MTARSEEFRKQVNELWKQANDQLEEVKDSVLRSTERFEADIHRLRIERDKLLKLLKRLGEQTYRLANEGKLPVPAIVRRTVDRLNEVIDGMLAQQAGGSKPAARRAAKKKTSAKKVSRKITKRPKPKAVS